MFKVGRIRGNDIDLTTTIFNDNQKRMLTWNQVNKCVFILHVYIYIYIVFNNLNSIIMF